MINNVILFLKKPLKLILCSSLLGLTACSTVQNITEGTPLILLTKTLPNAFKSNSVVKYETIPGPDLFITIKDVDGKYVINKITSTGIEKSIRLNDLTPEFNTRSYNCGEEKSLVAQTACRDLPEFFDTNLKYHKRYAYREANFSPSLYQNALKEALKDVDRKGLIEKYQHLVEYRDKVKQIYSQKNHDNQVKSDGLYDKYSTEYEAKFNRIKVVLNIQDGSGFYDNSRDSYKFVSFSKNNIERDIPPSFYIKLDTDLNGYDNALSKISKEIDANSVIDNDHVDQYEKYLVDQISKDIVISKASITRLGDYAIEVTAPDRINIASTASPEIPVKLAFLSKDFFRVYPKSNISDKYINLVFDGASLTISNLSDNFLEVKSISVYQDNNILTRTYSKPIELPPQSKMDQINIDDFKSDTTRLQRDYLNMTALLAKSTNINFGFAVKYKVGDQNIEKTLFKKNSYSLYDMLANL